jgi:actin related protein 2/3 complex subunit 1A/1B
VSVCYFEQDNDWWVSKHVKGPTSTVLDVAWHPNNVLLATASSDGQCRVVSAFVRGVDTKDAVGGGTAFGSKLPFATVCKEIPVGSWVHTVKWSPSGNRLAFATHDSTLHILECATADHQLISTKYQYLPLMDLLFLNENSIVGVGHDYNPLLFQFAGQWKFSAKLDVKAGTAKKAQSNLQMFQNMDSKGQAAGATETVLETKHMNCITTVQLYGGTLDKVTQFSTSALDGQIAVWDVPSIEKSIPGLKV